MTPGPLRQNQDQRDHDDGDDERGERPAEIKSAVGERLVEKIAERRTERPRQNKGRPKEENSRGARREIKKRENREAYCERRCAAEIAEPGRIGHPIAERRTERLRKGNRRPIKGFRFRRRYRLDGDRAERWCQSASTPTTQANRSAEPPA